MKDTERDVAPELALIRKSGECRLGTVDMSADGALYPTDAQLALCTGCPVLAMCKTYALAHDPDGQWPDIWGGLTGAQRADENRRRLQPRCPMCGANTLMIIGRDETCMSCGTAWRI